jgi:two-component system cell cycle response regulator
VHYFPSCIGRTPKLVADLTDDSFWSLPVSEFDNPEIFRSILETLPTGVYLVDRNRKILFWNEGAENVTGYLRQDVVGHFLREHLLAADKEVKDAQLDSTDSVSVAFRDGKSTTAHVSILHKEGYRVPIVLRTVPIRDEHGAVIVAVECFEINLSLSERTRRLAAVAKLGCLDEMLGIPARSFMEPNLRERVAAFAERQIRFGILLIQVEKMDHFRTARGPGVVPAILRVVAQTIENSLRPTDLVGCWSENQFMVILIGCNETAIDAVAQRIVNMISQSEIEWWGDMFSVTAAFGGAGSRPGDTWDLLVDRAKKSLSKSIANAGNRATVPG